MSICSKLLILRALCNGKTLAFQAKDAGSIPAARSSLSDDFELSLRRNTRVTAGRLLIYIDCVVFEKMLLTLFDRIWWGLHNRG